MKRGRTGGTSDEIVVFMTRSDPRCDFCNEDLGRGAWIRKHSGRVGRSAAAMRFDHEAVDFAVIARVRHAHTRYDVLLAEGLLRDDARAEVRDEIDVVLRKWSRPLYAKIPDVHD